MNFSQNIVDFISPAFKKYADGPAFTALGHTLTFADVERLSGQFAVYLQEHTSLEPGDRVAVQLPNLLQYPVVVLGALRAGMVLVNVNPMYTPRELEHQLKDSGARLLVVLANFADTAEAVIGKTQVEQVVVTQVGDMHPGFKGGLINLVLKYIKKQVPSFHIEGAIKLKEALSKGQGGQPKPISAELEDIAVLQYTGGTTGVAKGAMLTHKNLVSNALQLWGHLPEIFTEERGLHVAPLPLYHVYAFTTHCLAGFTSGNCTLLIPNPRDLDAFVLALKAKPFRVFVGLNTLFNALCNHPGFQALDFSSLRATSSGGMALTQDAADHWREVTGCDITEGYGLTETSPVACANIVGDPRPGTVGLPLPQTAVKAIDANGQSLPPGEAGELCIRGPQVMKGYWQRPEATAQVMTEDGWFRTGDVAVIGEDRYVSIVDRLKDMILVSGFNVYPNEIEDVVSLHPDVVECAAIGVADDVSGEVVKIFVVRKDPALTEEAILAYCKEQLTGYKRPKLVEFRDELPKSNVGKVLRKELRPKD